MNDTFESLESVKRMAYRQVQAPPPPPQQSTNNGGGCLVLTVIICATVRIMITFYAAAQAISVENYIIGLLLGGGTVLCYLWVMKHKKEEQLREAQARQEWMQYQQAQQAWIQQQQAQQEWINYQQQKQREADLAEQARKEQERLAHLNSLGALLALTPTQFEEIVCKLLATIKGLYSVKRVGGSGDLVADIIARNNHGELVVIQCKRYAPGRTIGSPEIQKFIGMMHVHHKTKRGIFVTTSTFTQPAIDLANEHDIDLIDGERLVDMVRRRLALS